MNPILIKADSLIKCKGFDVSIGRRTDQIGIISQSTNGWTKFSDIKKGGKLAKIKRKFGARICDNNAFFFERMTEEETLELIKILK